MRGAKATVKTPENIEKFVKYVSGRPGVPISSAKMAEYMNASKTTIHAFWDLIPERLGGTVTAIPSKGFLWEPPVTLKNSEGYPDPTAQMAIGKVDKIAAKREGLGAGQVWKCFKNNGDACFFLVIAVRDDYCLGLHIRDDDADLRDDSVIFALQDSASIYHVDPIRLSSKPIKYMSEMVCNLDENTMADITNIIGRAIDIRFEDLEERDIEIAELKTALANDELTIKELRENINLCTDEYNIVEKRNAELEDHIKMLEGDCDRVDKDNKELVDRNIELSRIVEELEAKNDDLKAKLWCSEEAKRLGAEANTRNSDIDERLYIMELETKVKIYEKLIFGMGRGKA